MMASEEIRLSATTMRRMPVLAQGQSAGFNDPNLFDPKTAADQYLQGQGTIGPNGYVPAAGDSLLLAQLMFAEAAGNPSAYPYVGWTIVNRVGDSEFGSTLPGVVYQFNQYQSVGGNLWNAASSSTPLTGPNATSYNQAIGVANGITSGQITDPTGGATFFYSGPTPRGFFQTAINSGALVPTATVGPYTILAEP